MNYRLGLDLGANSVGWCLLELDEDMNPFRVARIGSRIFSNGRDPQKGTSLAANRRQHRQMRKMRDRYIQRRTDLMRLLIKLGLMPKLESERKRLQDLDPYVLRARGVSERITLHHLGRAIFHLNQRRGFKSNRKTDKDEKESGLIRCGIATLHAAMEASGAETYGQFLYQRRQSGQSVRARPKTDGREASYDFYPTRELLEAEFDRLWTTQATYHPELTDQVRESIEGTLFFQRPLKPVVPGRCTFNQEEQRAPWALPLTQRFRILQELGNLRILLPDLAAKALTVPERDTLLKMLLAHKEIKFDAMRKALKLGDRCRFNLESDRRNYLKGDETAVILGHKDRFGKAWRTYSFKKQTEIVETLLQAEDEAALIEWLMAEAGVDAERAARIASTRLPDRYARLGRTAMGRIAEIMETDAVPYFEAATRAYSHHSDFRTGEVFENLPYYGIPLGRYTSNVTRGCDEEIRYGRITNPTVHIGLRQLQKLVNSLILEYGPPTQIVLELARELKLSQEAKRRILKEQKKNQEANDHRRDFLNQRGLADNAENLLRLRLWEELHGNPLRRRCVYTGEIISMEMLFTPAVEIDHILPFSRTLDNSAANKVVCLRKANRDKTGMSPYEVFSESPNGYDWEGILQRAVELPENKAWRFGPEAMDRFEGKGDFLDRHLTDTQYLSSAAREYLTCICDQVWVTPGRLTYMLRRAWGLPKSRDDHRHHAIDAAVVAATDRGMLMRVARAAARSEREGLPRLLSGDGQGWEWLREGVMRCLDHVVVSHKPDHNVNAGLHNEIAYGYGEDDGGLPMAIHRVPILSIHDSKSALKIRSATLRDALLQLVLDSQKAKERVLDFSMRTGIRRVRIQEKLELIPIRDAAGNVYKGYKGDANAFVEVFRNRDGRWGLEVVSTFDANQSRFMTQRQRQSLPMVMRLFRGDMLALGNGDDRRIFRLVKFSQGQGLVLAEHFEAGSLKKRDADPADPFKYVYAGASALQSKGARKVSVDILCRVRDPGAKP